jgi:hypothetical protein
MNFEDIAKLQIGDEFRETAYGMTVELRVCTKPTNGEGFDGRPKLEWIAEDKTTGRKVEYMITKGLEHYGPQLSRVLRAKEGT